jgi:hypothetical protein
MSTPKTGGTPGRENRQPKLIREVIQYYAELFGWDATKLEYKQAHAKLYEKIFAKNMSERTFRNHVNDVRAFAVLRAAMPAILEANRDKHYFELWPMLKAEGSPIVERISEQDFDRVYQDFIRREGERGPLEENLRAEIAAERVRMIEDACETYGRMPRRNFTAVQRYEALSQEIRNTFGRGEIEGIVDDIDSEDVGGEH